MPLIDLKTDLKSLKYGKDRIGGGNSGQPYIQTPIPTTFEGVGNTGGLDQLTRGGSLIGSSVVNDSLRISRFLASPSGLTFIAKQQGLEIAKNITLFGLDTKKWTTISTVPISTIANTALAPTGQHLANIALINGGASGVNSGGGYLYGNPDMNIPREGKYGEGNTYNSRRKRNNALAKSRVDKINYQPLYQSNSGVEKNLEDTVDFRIVKVNNDGSGNNTYIHFRSFIEGLSNNYGASWSTKKYMGRGEDFYSYDGFSRDISFSFKVPVLSALEQRSVYSKLNYLASLCAPDYSDAGLMRGNLIKLTIGDYLVDVPGIMMGINLSISDEAGWDIARDSKGNKIKGITNETGGKVMPKLIEVSGFSFKPIHNFIPKTISQKFVETGDGFYVDAPFISYGNTIPNQLDSKYGYESFTPSKPFLPSDEELGIGDSQTQGL